MPELSENHISDLLHSYNEMDSTRKALARSIRNEAPQEMFLPTYVGPADEQGQAVIKSLIEIWNIDSKEVRINAGLLCASDNVIDRALALNEAKKCFQQAVAAIRALSPDSAKRSGIDKLALRALADQHGRSKELKKALASARISRLNLTHCYRQIRVLPSKLESISWTWAKSHSDIKEVSMDQALELADTLLAEETRQRAFEALNATANTDAIFAQKKDKSNQLRANIVFEEDGLRKRKSVTISGIVLCPSTTLPRCVWRDNPGLLDIETDRLTRSDKRIESEPFIKELRLYRYKR